VARKRSRQPPASIRSTAPAGTPADRRRVWLLMAALAALTIATYTPVWRFAFVALDDPQYVYANPDLASGLTVRSVVWALTTGHEANWHPLTWLSHALDISLFGMNAGWHHAENLLLHLVNTLLLFGVLRRMTGSAGPSAFVAAVFAVHPLHVESVAWVAERKDVLSTLFFMLSLGAYVRYVDAPSARRYAAVAALLAIGLTAKAMLVTMPFVLLLVDYWPLGRLAGAAGATHVPRPQKSARQLIVEKIPLFAIVAASSVATFVAQRQGGAMKDLEVFRVGMRLQNAAVSYADYLRAAFWPSGLGVFYPFPSSLPSARVALSLLVLAVITAAAVLAWRRLPALTVGWFWFAGMLVPVIGFVQVGMQARADRYMYLPLVGLSIAVAWGAVALARTEALRRAVAALGVAIVLACAVAAHAQVQYWRETVGLWSRAAQVTEGSDNVGVYFGLAEYLRANGRAAESIPVYEAAIQKNVKYRDARLGLVRALIDVGRPAQAIDALGALTAIEPALFEARMSLGVLLLQERRAPEAVEQLQVAVRLQPDSAESHWRLALALAQSGRLPEALPEFAEAVRLAPAEAAVRNDYGWALAQAGQPAAGAQQLQEAVRLKPDFVDARHNLGRVLAAENRTAEALTQLSEAVRLEPGFTAARLSLGITLLRAGRIDDGARELREVLRQDPQNETAARALQAIGR
jgi:tetratricopeptide (TPR) repeat protein